MNIQSIKPTSKVLKRYIKYFLFMTSEDISYNYTHTSFPNTNVCLGLFEGNRLIETSSHNYTVCKSNNYGSYLTGMYHKPITFQYNGKFSEVCIDFEPLGLEVISGQKLSSHLFLNGVIEATMSKQWEGLYKRAFSAITHQARTLLMEEFLLQEYFTNNHIEFYPFNEIYSSNVIDLQSSFNKSYRTIHRIYKDNLGIGPKDFLMMKRFRMSLEGFQSFQRKNKLGIEHNTEFSDQSHFIRNFKKYTGFTPTTFIKNSHFIDNNVWIRIEKENG